MKIEEVVDVLNALKKEHGNVDVRAVAPMNAGFLRVTEVLHRNAYRDEGMLFGPAEKGNFVCVEVE